MEGLVTHSLHPPTTQPASQPPTHPSTHPPTHPPTHPTTQLEEHCNQYYQEGKRHRLGCVALPLPSSLPLSLFPREKCSCIKVDMLIMADWPEPTEKMMQSWSDAGTHSKQGCRSLQPSGLRRAAAGQRRHRYTEPVTRGVHHGGPGHLARPGLP